MKLPINFRKETFWDYDIGTINMEQNAPFIISRILMNGSWEEWKEVLKYYGEEEVKRNLLNTRYLDNKSLSYASFIFNVPKEKFRCYTLKQLSPPLWDY